MNVTRGRAPGRLDLLGGVADYSGALVLQIPTQVATTVTATPSDALRVGPVVLAVDELLDLAQRPYAAIRTALADAPPWTRYPIGVALVLVRHGLIDPPQVELSIESEVPVSVGVSSSAALEVATARALGVDDLDALELARRCQEAENQVVGAPCGIMDQVAVALGTTGAVLPVLCRPASVGTAIALPGDAEVVGWPTGATHDVGGGPYRRARAAAFMGKRMVEATVDRTWSWGAELPPDVVADLPEAVDGSTFLDRWDQTDDDLTEVEAGETYPVRAATAFGGEEHRRTEQAAELLSSGDARTVGPLMAASHAGYDAMGLGHQAATAVVEEVLARAGVHGARSSGGGAGGTVVVLCRRGALDEVPDLIR
jgi:L-arabinokinase